MKLYRKQGSFPAGTPGNGVPKVILTMGTAFKPALGELYKKQQFAPKFAYLRSKIENIFPFFVYFCYHYYGE